MPRLALDTAVLKQKNDQRELIDLIHQQGIASEEAANKAREASEKTARAAEEAARKNQELVAQVARSNEQVANQAREISNQQIEYSSRLKKDSDLANDSSEIQRIKKESQDQLDVLKEQTEQYRLQADAKIKAASDTYRGVEQRTQTQVQTGTLSPGQRIAILQQAAAQEYAAQLDAIQKKEALDAGYAAKYQQDLNQQTALTQAYYQKQQQLALQGRNSSSRSTSGCSTRSTLPSIGRSIRGCKGPSA